MLGLWQWSGNEGSAVPMEVAWFSTTEEGTAKLQQDQDHVSCDFLLGRWCPSLLCPFRANNKEYYSVFFICKRCNTRKMATAVGNWWLAASSQHGTLLMYHVSCRVFGETSNHPGDSAWLYSPDLEPCDLWLLPKLNHLWKGRDFRPLMRFKKIRWGSW